MATQTKVTAATTPASFSGSNRTPQAAPSPDDGSLLTNGMESNAAASLARTKAFSKHRSSWCRMGTDAELSSSERAREEPAPKNTTKTLEAIRHSPSNLDEF